MIFKDPGFLIMLVFVPLLLLIRRKDRAASLDFSSKSFINGLKPTFKLRLEKGLIFLRIIAAILFIICLARPQMPIVENRVFRKGIDMVLVLDTSTSMEALDFKINKKRYNRLYVAKKVVEEFIPDRFNDRIGMIAFAARPYIVCPLTLDHNWLLSHLERVEIGMVEDGTAIGSAIAAALNRLKISTAKTKIIILLTDGRNNAGKISPLTAAEAAKALKVKIYTIGAGEKGMVPYPVKDLFGNAGYQNVEIDLDEESLKKIAETSGGRYFRATDTSSLKKVYAEINKLEKTAFKQPIFTQYKELFEIFLVWGLVLLLLEHLLASTILIKVP